MVGQPSWCPENCFSVGKLLYPYALAVGQGTQNLWLKKNKRIELENDMPIRGFGKLQPIPRNLEICIHENVCVHILSCVYEHEII